MNTTIQIFIAHKERRLDALVHGGLLHCPDVFARLSGFTDTIRHTVRWLKSCQEKIIEREVIVLSVLTFIALL